MKLSSTDWLESGGVTAGFGAHDAPAPGNVVTVHQVHGADVVICGDLAPGDHREIAGDALVVTRTGIIVGVKTADCVPVLLLSPRSATGGERWAAAVHAGWRGCAGGVIGAAVADAARRGHAPRSLLAAVGPAIGACCYEVGDEVADTFRALGLPVLARGGKPHLDLPRIAVELLQRAGLAPGSVVLRAPCTRCNPDRYHSYRANGPRAGRQISWIGLT